MEVERPVSCSVHAGEASRNGARRPRSPPRPHVHCPTPRSHARDQFVSPRIRSFKNAKTNPGAPGNVVEGTPSPLLSPMASHPPSEKPSGADDELALARDQVLTNGDKHNLPTHVQHSDDLEGVEPKPSHSLTAAWDRFNGRGRKRVGFLQSVKAVVFSSCTFTPTGFGSPWDLLRIPRLERVVGVPPNRVGFPLPSLGRKQDFRMCVPSSGSRLAVHLLITVGVFG